MLGGLILGSYAFYGLLVLTSAAMAMFMVSFTFCPSHSAQGSNSEAIVSRN
jgi:hypothetical protein